MTVFITFSSIGTDAGPFNLYSNVDGFTSAFVTGITRAQLLAGYPSDIVPDGTTTIRAKSFGVCTNFVNLNIAPAPTSTTSTTLAPPTTSTTTIAPTTSTTTSSTTIAPSTTTTTTIPFNFISLGTPDNKSFLGGGNVNFTTARNTAIQAGTVSFNIGCYLVPGNVYGVSRAFYGFNTTPVTTATIGGIEINIVSNGLISAMQYVIVRTVNNFPYNHAWDFPDFPESNGGVIETAVVTINPGQTGIVQFPFNATGLAYVNGSNDSTFALVQYPNDYLNDPPSLSSQQDISGGNIDVKLYYF